MDPALATPGSIAFVPPAKPFDLEGDPVWWQFVLSADWRHPLGSGSSVGQLAKHPVASLRTGILLALPSRRALTSASGHDGFPLGFRCVMDP